ncbi:MAG: hypothetical protein ACYC0P_03015 [Thiobacillus sp.]
MNARLPTPTPDQLIEQWTPMMRGLAYSTGTAFEDIRQEAWLLAATMPRGDVGGWLAAVRCHAAAQRPGVTVRPSARRAPGEEYIGSAWLAGAIDIDDDPCDATQAAETVALAVGGAHGDDDARWQRIRQEIEMPRSPAEIAAARGVSERQGRRDAAKMRTLEAAQARLFDAEVTV